MKADEFVREVNEEMQRDRLLSLWRRYGVLVVALAVLLVVGTAGWVGWQAWRGRQLEADAARFATAETALKAGQAKAAAGQFAAIAGDGEPQGALARLREADARFAAGDRAGALAALHSLAANADAPPMLKGLAAVLAAQHELATATPAALRVALEPQAVAGAPWAFLARELLALVDLRAGDVEAARRRLTDLGKEAGLPPDQQQRVEELLAAIGGPTTRTS